MAYAEALLALADPTRRKLLQRVRKAPHTVTGLARAVGVSQPAVSQHLRVLRRARLVREERDGNRLWISASTTGVDDLRRYLDAFWDDVLAAYANTDSN